MTGTSLKNMGKRVGRSPAYPSIPLSEALDKAKAQYDTEGKYPAPLPSAFKSWGYSLKSSGGREIRASLRYFGLIVVEGEGDLAKIKLTEDAIRVLIDRREDKSERNAIIHRLALNPSAHKKLWSRFPDGIKSEASASHYLVIEEGYNESAAQALIKEFKQTAEFAQLYEPLIDDDLHESDGTEPYTLGNIEIGDLVQIELNGVLQPGSFRVRDLREQGGNIWVFVDGSDAAVSIDKVILERKIHTEQKLHSTEVATDSQRFASSSMPPLGRPSEREWLRGELSKQVSYRIIVTGEVGPREIGKLITLLKAQQTVLADDYDQEG